VAHFNGTSLAINLTALVSATCLFTFSGAGCGGPASDGGVPLGQSRQALTTIPWSPVGAGIFGNGIVGIGNTSNSPYIWYDNGMVCRTPLDTYPCAMNHFNDPSYVYPYAAPGQYADIRAVGIALHTDNTPVFAWYANSTVSKGTSDDLAKYAAPQPFTPAMKPNGTPFTMDELIDADNPDNTDNWYYYWKDSSLSPDARFCHVYRTIGTYLRADAVVAATVANCSGLTIAGISFRGSQLQVWYPTLRIANATQAGQIVEARSTTDLTAN